VERGHVAAEQGWSGDRWIESNIPKFFRIGTVDTHRTILGTGYAVMGSLFAIIGIVVLVRAL
jgi:hypothetical protein